MQFIKTEIEDVLLIKPAIFPDARGYFMEGYNERVFASHGLHQRFVQDNQSRSRKGVIRGLHYQISQPQGKLVRVIMGEVYDVAVDLRRRSATFGKWVARVLSGENKDMLWIPPGFAHGFAVLSEHAEMLYKATDYYAPDWQRTVLWNDPDLNIAWPIQNDPILSAQDIQGAPFREAEVYSDC